MVVDHGKPILRISKFLKAVVICIIPNVFLM